MDQDWMVEKITLTGDVVYPYRVVGQNLNYAENHMDRMFRWNVPDICERFDLTNAEFGEGVRERLAKDA